MAKDERKRILVVDDEPATAQLIRHHYREEPVEILEARDGDEGIRKAHTDSPDVILMDVKMPGADGFEVCRRLKADPRTHGIPVVMLTAQRDTQSKTDGFDLGIDDYIVKPFDVDEVAARIRAMLRKREQNLKLEAENAQLLELATVDELTRLANYRVFTRRLQEEWLRSVRYPAALSLVMLDLDDFKKVNDTLGHQAGDRVLRQFALLVAGGARATDVAARYGGEEFALILPHTEQELAYRVAERIRRAVEVSSFLEGDPAPRVTVSAGVATATNPANLQSPAELVAIADQALYAAKKAGKNRVLLADAPFKEARPPSR